MKNFWSLALAALTLSACTLDATLDTLVPRDALAVAVVDHPRWVLPSASGDLPPGLDADKPWAGALLPASPPGFFLAVALKNDASAWSSVAQWARERGGLVATHVGSYAVLTSPGLPEPAVLDRDRRFDLARVRTGDPVAVYVDVANVVRLGALPPALGAATAAFPWAQQNLRGLRLGFSEKDGGLQARLSTDWLPGAAAARPLKAWVASTDPATWTALLPADGVGLVASLPPRVWTQPASDLPGRLGAWWSALSPLLGPRLAVAVVPRGDDWSWSLALETKDPQAVRQAVKTLIAGGDLQSLVPPWVQDPDTPVLYQDRRGPAGIEATVHWGPRTVEFVYGNAQVALAGGSAALDVARAWTRDPAAPAEWSRSAPAGSSALVSGSWDGLVAHASLRVLSDANVEFAVWIDAASVKTWEERLPQALLQWVSSEGGLTRFEP